VIDCNNARWKPEINKTTNTMISMTCLLKKYFIRPWPNELSEIRGSSSYVGFYPSCLTENILKGKYGEKEHNLYECTKYIKMYHIRLGCKCRINFLITSVRDGLFLRSCVCWKHQAVRHEVTYGAAYSLEHQNK